MLKKLNRNDTKEKKKKNVVYERHKKKEWMENKSISMVEKILLGQNLLREMEDILITRASLPANLFLEAKLSVKNLISRSLNSYEMQLDYNDLKNWQQTFGFFCPTMLHYIALWLWKSTLQGAVLPLCNSLLILPT